MPEFPSASRQPASAEAMPIVPNLSYLAELGVTHLGGDLLLRGSNGIARFVTAGIEADLARPLTNWHTGGHFGEVGKTALVLDGEPHSTAEKVIAVRRSAAMMVALSVTDAVAGEQYSGRNADTSAHYLEQVNNIVRGGAAPDRAPSNGPVRQEQGFRAMHNATRYLKEDGRLTAADREQLGEYFEQWSIEWTDMLRMTERRDLDPTLLLYAGRNMGVFATQMARIASVGSTPKPHGALNGLGAIGGIENEGSRPFQAAKRGIHTYQTALLAQEGPGGLKTATRMRLSAERNEYVAMEAYLETPRQRRVADTVVAFTRLVGALQRRKLQSGEVQDRLMARLAGRRA